MLCLRCAMGQQLGMARIYIEKGNRENGKAGFSFHTLELRWNPTDVAFANVFNRLQQCSCGGEFYPVKEVGGIFAWRSNAFSRNGIQVFLTRGHQNMISLTVNPRKLIEPDASCLGIVSPYQDTLEEIRVFFEMPSDMIISWKGGRRDADRKSDKRERISGRNAAILQ